MTGQYPPGPRGTFLGLTTVLRMRADPVALALEMARKYGDFVFARLGWIRAYFVSRPELIRTILATKVQSFPKLPRQRKALTAIDGNGLVISEGAVWRRMRPMVQPAFHSSHFEHYARLIVEHARRRCQRWLPETTFDMAEEMNQLALEIIARLVFDVDWGDRSARLRAAVEIFRDYMQREMNSFVRLPDWVPLPGKLRQRRAVREVDRLVWELIRERRATGLRGKDMLSLMLAAPPRPGEPMPMTDQEARNEAVTLFVAGHDTTSAALGWWCYLMGRHPEVARRVQTEIDTVLGARAATYADAGRLRYTEMTVRESMRMYSPSGFLFFRRAAEDVDLGGYRVRRGSWIIISPHMVHRDPRNFKSPEVFDPERFAPGRVNEIPDYAYLPFGGGPRICIGNALAIMESVLVAATVLQKWNLTLAPDQGEVQPELKVVLRLKGGVRMRLTPREPVGLSVESGAAGRNGPPGS